MTSICILMFCASLFPRAGQGLVPPPVVVESDPARAQTTYRVAEGPCRITWAVYHSKPNVGVIRHNAECPLPFERQAGMISAILGSVLKDATVATSLHTLFLGTFRSSSAMPDGLAVLASRSPDWNVSTGRATSGTTDAFTAKIANDGKLYREWDDLFRPFDRTVRVSAVENVSVSRAGDLPSFLELARQGVKQNDRLPHDALVWLVVSARDTK